MASVSPKSDAVMAWKTARTTRMRWTVVRSDFETPQWWGVLLTVCPDRCVWGGWLALSSGSVSECSRPV